MQTIIKPHFYPQLCQFLMKIIPVINWACACDKTSVEDDDFLTEGCLGMCEPNDFYLSFYVLVWHRENIIPGNFGFAITKY